MLRCIVDGTEVALPADTSFEIYRENPFFESKGDYTYDIDIDLRVPVNARLYEGLRRVNGVFSFESTRKAELWDGARCICRGTEVVLAKEGDKVKIQIVAGNSEMNYLAGSEHEYIRELNLGTVSATREDAEEVATKIYPAADHVYPLMLQYGLFGDWTHLPEAGERIYNYNEVDEGGNVLYNTSTPLYPCPYLLAMVRKVLSAMGYEITYSSLDEERWNRLYMLNLYGETEYAKMLPDWTTQKFITEVENFFNAVIIIRDDKAMILTMDEFYSNENNVAYIGDEDVEDSFSIESEKSEDNVFRQNSNNVEYNVEETLYYKYATVDRDTASKLRVENRRCEDLDASAEDPTDLVMYWDYDRLIHFALYYNPETSYKSFEQTMQFSPIFRGESLATISLSIVPAEIGVFYLRKTDYPVGFAFCPRLFSSQQEDEEPQDITVEKVIMGQDGELSPDRIKVAFYMGLHDPAVWPASPSSRARTQSITDRYRLFGASAAGSGATDVAAYLSNYDERITLKLSGRKSRETYDFSRRLDIDTAAKYTFRIHTHDLLDPMLIFVIRNRRYICKQLKYEYRNGQSTGCAEGEFYPLK